MLFPVSVGVYSPFRFLGIVDKLGAAYEEQFTATSFGLYFCLPLLRNLYRENLSEDEARKILEECARVGYYRNCLASNRVRSPCSFLEIDSDCESHK